MGWKVELHSEFFKEFQKYSEDVQDSILVKAMVLEEFGPQLGRPHADTLIGSEHDNMKELRFSVGNGVWRVAFAFDPKRKAILLVAGNKRGANQKKFYKKLIASADVRFNEHLKELKDGKISK